MRMTVPLASLATLLDLPPGVTVTGVDSTEALVVLQLEGVPALQQEGGDLVVEISAEYSVDAKGHRSFRTFMLPEPAPVDDSPPPVVATELVGSPPAPAKAAGATKKAGS